MILYAYARGVSSSREIARLCQENVVSVARTIASCNVRDSRTSRRVLFSIQGEGVTAGVPAVFVRLQGCSVGLRRRSRATNRGLPALQHLGFGSHVQSSTERATPFCVR